MSYYVGLPHNLEVQSQGGIFGIEGTQPSRYAGATILYPLGLACTAGARCWLYWHCPCQMYLVIGENRPNTDILKERRAVFLQTTRLTCVRAEPLVSKTGLVMKGSSYLKKPLQPPHLEYPFSHQDGHLKDTPPFDPSICTLRRVPVHLLPHHDIGLLIFDLLDEHREHVHYKQRNINQQSAVV